MIKDLDETIKELLVTNLPLQGGGQIHISFERPDEQFELSPAVNVFLYNLEENLERRTSEMLVVETEGTNAQGTPTGKFKRFPRVKVDFSYMITTWSSGGALEEHLILGETMKVLMKYRTIPALVLQGSLIDLRPLPVAFALQYDKLKSLGEFWQAMGGKPRPAIHYTVTLDVDVDDVQEITLVTGLQPDIFRSDV